jgi:hypothetical protein
VNPIPDASDCQDAMPLSFHDLMVSLRRITDRIPNMMPGRRRSWNKSACIECFLSTRKKVSMIIW